MKHFLTLLNKAIFYPFFSHFTMVSVGNSQIRSERVALRSDTKKYFLLFYYFITLIINYIDKTGAKFYPQKRDF